MSFVETPKVTGLAEQSAILSHLLIFGAGSAIHVDGCAATATDWPLNR
jgi:hypothetical protein